MFDGLQILSNTTKHDQTHKTRSNSTKQGVQTVKCLVAKHLSFVHALMSTFRLVTCLKHEIPTGINLRNLLPDLQKSKGKRTICKPSKECVRKCKDYVIAREITTMLRIAMDKDIAAFTFAAWQVGTCLLCKFMLLSMPSSREGEAGQA